MEISLGERLLCLFFPARCLSCGQVVPPDSLFCKRCAPAVQAPPPREFPLENGKTLLSYAPMYYRNGFRKTLHRYKFRGQWALSHPLGRLCAPQARLFPVDFDAVTYVPLSKVGKRRRGYDQSQRLAKSLALALGLPLLPALEKVRETDTQHQLGKSKRQENVKGAYRAGPAAAGKTLLLVDDIVTTGATLRQCAQMLYDAGAAQVCALCAASAQKKEGSPHGPL